METITTPKLMKKGGSIGVTLTEQLQTLGWCDCRRVLVGIEGNRIIIQKAELPEPQPAPAGGQA